ncbi:MAG: hypothetical protein JNK53_06860 [Phycisphaerae bacterium]|nr:hypothetical protein [Phycisphaerae bacterium]
MFKTRFNSAAGAAAAAAAATTIACTFAPAATAMGTDVDYVGASGSVWSASANWSPMSVPNNTGSSFFDVIINQSAAPTLVQLDMSATIDSLRVNLGDQLAMLDTRSLAIVNGSVTNHGVISMNSLGNTTEFRVGVPSLLLTGSGTFAMGNSSANVVRHNYGSINRLVNDTGHTIRGAGQIGANSIMLTNRGLIQADQPTALAIDLYEGDTNYNEGIMQATDGARLWVGYCGTLDNQNGLFRAKAASRVEIEATTILGGEFTTEGTGVIAPVGNTPAFVDTLLTGTLRIEDTRSASFFGTLTNQSQIQIESVGNTTEFRVGSPTLLLTGPGTLALGNSSANVVRHNYGSINRLVNDTGHTIRGAGQIGANSIMLTNRGLIEANQATPIWIDLYEGETNYNEGVMQATDGAKLWVGYCGTFDNHNGLFRAKAGSRVELEATTFVGGEFTTEGTGVIAPVGNTPALVDTLLTGTMRIDDTRSASFFGTLTNQSQVQLASAGNTTEFRVGSAELHLAGSGTLSLGNSTANVVRHNYGSINRLINDATHTIRGAGQIGANSISVLNQGTVIADLSAGMYIDAEDSLGVENQGTVRVSGAGYLNISSCPFTTSGSVEIDAGRLMDRSGPYQQTGGTTVVDGQLTVTNGALNVLGGTVSGNGTIVGAVNNSDGTVAPGSSPGALQIQGTYTQGQNGVLAIEIAGYTPGTQHDVLNVSGTAALNGALALSLAKGFAPTLGSQFTILNAGARTGQFAFLVPCNGFEVSYTATAVVVTIVGATLPADLNCDGVVNGSDLGILLGNWGPCQSAACTGDLNGDGIVNGADLGELLGSWS